MAQPATVLILADVGDSERVALEAACTAAGFSPSVEPSAEAATQKMTAKRFDALVVHLGTPGAALACMRARGKLLRTRVPVLALVDTEDEPTFSRAYRAGADEVLLLDRPDWLTARLRTLPRSAIPQPGNARGDAVVADADRTRAEVVERVLRDAGFRVEVAVDGFSTRLQAGRPSLKVAVIDASLDDVPSLIIQAKGKGARCAWVVRARPEQLDEIRLKLARIERVAVLSAFGPPDDVLFEVNRLLEPRTKDGRREARLLSGGILRLKWSDRERDDIGYSYNWSATGIFVRTLATPESSKVAVEMTPPGAQQKLHLDCEVVWRREFGATRKEPVPAGFALKIVGGDVVAWARVCPRTSSLPPAQAEPSVRPPAAQPSGAPPATAPKAAQPGSAGPAPAAQAVAAPTEVEIRREAQSSVEAMLASVLSESATEDEGAGAAPLSIDGGTVVALHADSPDASGFDDQITKVQNAPSELSAAVTPYTAERARQELLATALDASKTPLAVPRNQERPAPPRVEPRTTSVIPRPGGASLPPRPEQKATTRPAAVASPAPTEAPPALEPRRKSDRPPPEAGGLDLSDITPASIGFDLSEDGRIIEEVRRLPPVAERKPDARASARPSMAVRPSMQSPSRGGTLAGTGGPAPFDLLAKDRPPEPAGAPPRTGSEPARASPALRVSASAVPSPRQPSEPPPSSSRRPSEPPSSMRRASEPAPPSSRPPPGTSVRPSSRPPAAPTAANDVAAAAGSKERGSPSVPPPAASDAAAARAAFSGAATVHQFSAGGLSSDGAPPRPTDLEPTKPPQTTTRVVAHADAVETGDTMRPAAAGLSESGPPPPLAGFRPGSFGAPPAATRAGMYDPEEEDFTPRKRRSSLGVFIAVAALLGGGAALFASPSFRKRAPEEPRATAPAALPPPAAPSAPGLTKASDTSPPLPTEPTTEVTASAAAPSPVAASGQPAAPSAAASAMASSGPATATKPTPSAEPGAQTPEADLAALPPGQGYLFVASPLATNVFIYANLAGTTNQPIQTKCGPRFIRLGTTLGNWQGEGMVQIVKCGALTRVEMGR